MVAHPTYLDECVAHAEGELELDTGPRAGDPPLLLAVLAEAVRPHLRLHAATAEREDESPCRRGDREDADKQVPRWGHDAFHDAQDLEFGHYSGSSLEVPAHPPR